MPEKVKIANFYPDRRREDFWEKSLDEDVIDLRYKHHCNRQLDTINRVLEERRMISKILCHVIYIEMRLIQRGLTDDERVYLGTAGPMKPARSMT
jgi:hypothetical protein